MSSSGSVYTFRELFEDRWFIPAVAGSIALVVAVMGSLIAWTHDQKISIRPIIDVVRLSVAGTGIDALPISEIAQASNQKPVAFTGYAIGLIDLCKNEAGFSSGFSNAFQKGTAKLLVTQKGTNQLTVANASINQATCKLVASNPTRFEGVSAVFNAQVPSFAGQWIKETYSPVQ
jgi:hypothetical protein